MLNYHSAPASYMGVKLILFRHTMPGTSEVKDERVLPSAAAHMVLI